MVTRYFISVRNIPWTVSHLDFETYFAAYGKIKQAQVIFDNRGVSTGYGFVEYYTRQEMIRALDTSQHILEETLVTVTAGTKYVDEYNVVSLASNYFNKSHRNVEPKNT